MNIELGPVSIIIITFFICMTILDCVEMFVTKKRGDR